MANVKSTGKPLVEWAYYAAIGVLVIYFGLPVWMEANSIKDADSVKVEEENCEEQEFHSPKEHFGFHHDIFHFFEGKIQSGQVLGKLFHEYGLNSTVVNSIVERSRDVFNIRQIKPGKNFAFIHGDPCQSPDYFVYEPDPFRYVLFRMAPPYDVQVVERPVEIKIETFEGQIESSLWHAMKNEGMSYDLIGKMEDALAWTVDFYTIQKGDRFRLLFERKYIDGKPAGIGNLLAANFESGDNSFYAIHYENERYKGYYDLEGRATKRAFLKSPVKFSRVSSGYNPKRFHPVLKRYKAHLGTDYAAPSGTKIFAVADGTITHASFTRNNGNFVKIRHDRTYETQYLHMKGFAAGIRPGRKVRQGDVIGYVGQTGLATGPHVCFRFWKNGRQVDHRRMNFPPPEPLPEEELHSFFVHRDQMLQMLNGNNPSDMIAGKEVKEIKSSNASAEVDVLSTPLP